MSEKIAVDIDDTLYSFGDLAREVMCDLAIEREDKTLQSGAYTSWSEWRTPPDIVGLDQWLEIIEICHKPERILSRQPYDYAQEILTELADQGHDLLYISNRSDSTAEATDQWLDRNEFPQGPTIYTSKAKTEYVADCRYLIDDRPKTLIEFVYDCNWDQSKPTRVGFGLHKNYNSSLTDVPGIKLAPDWKLLSKFFVKEGLL